MISVWYSCKILYLYNHTNYNYNLDGFYFNSLQFPLEWTGFARGLDLLVDLDFPPIKYIQNITKSQIKDQLFNIYRQWNVLFYILYLFNIIFFWRKNSIIYIQCGLFSCTTYLMRKMMCAKPIWHYFSINKIYKYVCETQ